MVELRGKYTDCKVFNDKVEETAMSQIYQFLNHSAFSNKKVRFMPDVHAGAGAVIGTTVELGDKVIPNVIGVDINCGMLSYKLGVKDIDLSSLDMFIHAYIPHGFNVNRERRQESALTLKVESVCKAIGIPTDRALLSIGTLGGGNHFIEVGKDESGFLWLTVHSGSRNFGLQIAKYHQEVAVKNCVDANELDQKAWIHNIPPAGREKALKAYRAGREFIPKGMEYLQGEAAELYFEHMKIAQQYASVNRYVMLEKILKHLKCDTIFEVESVHNYIDFTDNIIRKGAIRAHKGEAVIIPWNMRDGLIIGEGKGNPDWNFSAPHGAGRDFSRSKAKATFTMEEFEKEMEGVYSTCVNKSTLDESPMAYKNHTEILKYIEDTVEVKHTVAPIYNFKA